MSFLGESSLRRAVREYLAHYRSERAHQGLGNNRAGRTDSAGSGDVVCDERLGGPLKHYRRAA